ncbi:pentapeptide repeat protein [Umezawaea tangerina]|uniref:Pentapeptide repeat protein n=2 Tax=Umezawaea tangerina TaxID=84725 RepID=A0A2T0T4H9_9PSEU|nr:pentapeptide repeat protein [Umezawaea tangerina]
MLPVSDTNGRPRRRDQFLWLWPIGAVAVMAAAGHFFGAFGALLSAVVVVATLVLLIGDITISLRTRIWVLALAVLVAASVVVGRYAGVAILAAPADAFEPLDLRGQIVDADAIRGRDLQNAQLAGAVLDDLDLRGLNLAGVKAQGASFRRAVLDEVQFTGADLRGADFTDACLERSDLSGAQLGGMIARGADVTNVVTDKELIANVVSWPEPGNIPPQHCL